VNGDHFPACGFAELLRRYRLASGLSQEELASRSGLSVGTIANIERGRTTRPYRRSVRSLADALALTGPQREQFDRVSRAIAGGVAGPGPATAGSAIGEMQPPPVGPRQLPAAVPHFAGRLGELKALTDMLGETAGYGGAVVISTIGGTAGVGKTALAVHWAHQNAGRFPDGQLYVNLRGYDPSQPMAAADALAGFLRSLGVAGHDIPAETAERAALYRSLLAGRRMLVLLDNARESEQVRPLLPGTRGCAAIVTSRDTLAGLVSRDGARRVDLDLLPIDDAVSLLRALIGTRVEADPGAAVVLATQCCRLPLALRVAAEMAVARPAVPLAWLAAELADRQRRLALLDAGGDHQASVRAVFSWSYQRLDTAAARAFRLLGLHMGADFDCYTAAALTGTTIEQADHLLGLLARAYLIQPMTPGRYGTHDLLYAYARDLATAHDTEDERRAALTRLFDYYLHAASVAMDTLFPAEQHNRPRVPLTVGPSPPVTTAAVARAWLDAERENLVTASAGAVDHSWPSHVIRLAATLYRYLDTGGYSSEAAVIHSQARRAALHTGDRVAEARALTSLGAVDFQLGRYHQATHQLRQAIALYREVGDRAGEARALTIGGNVDCQQGRYPQATSLQRRALALYRGMGDRAGEAFTLGNLGAVYERRGRYQQATDLYQQALAVWREMGDPSGESYALTNLGCVYRRQGCCGQAAGYFELALAQFREARDRPGQAYVLTNLGALELQQGRYGPASDHQRRALALFRETGDRAGQAEALNGLGEALLAADQPGHARAQHTAALALASQTGVQAQQARAHDGLGHCYHADGNPRQASRHWQHALTLYTKLGSPETGQIRAQLTAAANGDHREP
jgi:tetratricopeptide (TPR) repeat protein/DNA-binding XRE family transcriptional regulator